MVDFLLINPSHSFLESHTSKKRRNREFFHYPPLGMLYVAAACEQQKIDVACIDAPAEALTIDECVERACEYEPKIVGISATTPQARSAVQIAKGLRNEFDGKISIGFGGTHARLDSEFVKKYPVFDWQLGNENVNEAAYGEITVPKIVSKILNGHEVKGFVQAESIGNIDAVPFPARHLLDSRLYRMPVYSNNFTALLTSRGCPWHCSFCAIPALNRQLMYRSAENVKQEILQCKEQFGLRNFQLVDDIFLVNKNVGLAVANAIGDCDVNFGFQTRVRLLHMQGESVVKQLRENGCKEISFGVEHGNLEVRVRNGKDFTDDMLKEVVGWCRKYGIETNFFYVIGLIGETAETTYDTINYFKRVEPTYQEFHLCIPYAGTEIFNYAVQNGLLPIDVWDKWIRGELKTQPIFIPSTMTKEGMIQAQTEAYKRFYFRSRYILRRLHRDLFDWHSLSRDYRIASTLFSEFVKQRSNEN